jgi:hypothetical protein
MIFLRTSDESRLREASVAILCFTCIRIAFLMCLERLRPPFQYFGYASNLLLQLIVTVTDRRCKTFRWERRTTVFVGIPIFVLASFAL